MCGTCDYWAPELAASFSAELEGKAAQPKYAAAATDVWALGCIVYELYQGQPPFAAGSDEEVLRLISSGELAHIHGVHMSKEGAAFLAGLMTPDPAKRMTIEDGARACASVRVRRASCARVRVRSLPAFSHLTTTRHTPPALLSCSCCASMATARAVRGAPRANGCRGGAGGAYAQREDPRPKAERHAGAWPVHSAQGSAPESKWASVGAS